MSNSIPEYQITNIHPPGQDHDRISNYWVPAFGRWLTVPEAVQMVKSKTCNFFVISRTGNKAYAAVIEPADKAPHLRTHADGQWDDNLRSLPGGTKAA